MVRGLFSFLVVMTCFLQAAAAEEQAAEEKPPLIEKIEEIKGIPLTLTQREAVAEAAQEMIRACARRQRALVAALKEHGIIPTLAEEALTPVDGLPFDFDKEALAVIEAHAAEPLEQLERDTIRHLDEEKGRDLDWIREAYAAALSGIVDLPGSLIMEVLEPAEAQEGEAAGTRRYP